MHLFGAWLSPLLSHWHIHAASGRLLSTQPVHRSPGKGPLPRLPPLTHPRCLMPSPTGTLSWCNSWEGRLPRLPHQQCPRRPPGCLLTGVPSLCNSRRRLCHASLHSQCPSLLQSSPTGARRWCISRERATPPLYQNTYPALHRPQVNLIGVSPGCHALPPSARPIDKG